MADEIQAAADAQPANPAVTPRDGAIAILALIVGALTGRGLTGKEKEDLGDVPTTLESVPNGVVRVVVDAGPEPEIVGPLTTDVASDVAQPGERVVTSVNLPAGWAPIGDITMTGGAINCFKLIATQLVGVEEKFEAQNICDVPLRFTAIFQYDKVKQ